MWRVVVHHQSSRNENKCLVNSFSLSFLNLNESGRRHPLCPPSALSLYLPHHHRLGPFTSHRHCLDWAPLLGQGTSCQGQSVPASARPVFPFCGCRGWGPLSSTREETNIHEFVSDRSEYTIQNWMKYSGRIPLIQEHQCLKIHMLV